MTNTLIHGIIDALSGSVSKEVIVFLISMIPILELRGALLVAGPILGVKVSTAIPICIIGNIIPVPFILLLITPVFNWIGKLFEPLLVLLQVPNAAEIAPSLPVGIAEMFLPVLMIADKVGTLAVGARYMVVTVSMVQIIFFSETIVVMLSTKIPVSLKELIICFFERTIVAIPISALFMHLLF